MPGGNCVKAFVRCIDGGKACSKVKLFLIVIVAMVTRLNPSS
jgi:hypothetical protein